MLWKNCSIYIYIYIYTYCSVQTMQKILAKSHQFSNSLYHRFLEIKLPSILYQFHLDTIRIESKNYKFKDDSQD